MGQGQGQSQDLGQYQGSVERKKQNRREIKNSTGEYERKREREKARKRFKPCLFFSSFLSFYKCDSFKISSRIV